MTVLSYSASLQPRSVGAFVVFGLVYLAALAIIFAPEGSLSSRATTDIVISSR